jgi:hypothetical protein
MRIFLFIVFFSWVEFSTAQVILIQENVNADTTLSETGPNRKKYNSGFYSIGMIFGAPDSIGSAIDAKASFHLQLGSRVKLKLNNVFSWGIENMLDYKSFRIKQIDDKTFGGDVIHKKEAFIVLSYELLFFTRINFDPKRGDHLGKYIDLGAFGGYNFLRRHKVVDTVNTQYGFERGKYIMSDLKYVEKFNYGLTARIGWWGLSLYCNYRLSDLFKPYQSIDYQELPRYEAGINIDIASVEWKENYMRKGKKYLF